LPSGEVVMFKIFGYKKKTPAEQRLAELTEILFPKPKVQVGADGSKYHIEYSLDYNLEGALTDLEMGHNDAVVQKTIREVVKSLGKARRLLQPREDVDEDITFFIVDTPEVSEESPTDHVEAREESF